MVKLPLGTTTKVTKKRAGEFLTPREVPLRFGYMRLSADNPMLATYRQMLNDAGIAQLFDDTPAKPDQRPQFEATLAEARPLDTIVMVRLNHLSTNAQVVARCVEMMAEQQLGIKLVQTATAGWPDSAAVVHDLLATITPNVMWFMCGGDGGGGNGGP